MTYLSMVFNGVLSTSSSVLVSATELLALVRYIAAVVDDGDYLNDWLTHLPLHWRPVVQELGEALAVIFGI